MIVLNFKMGGILEFYSGENINCIEASRVHPEFAHAVLAPMKSSVSSDRNVDVNIFHAPYANQTEVL